MCRLPGNLIQCKKSLFDTVLGYNNKNKPLLRYKFGSVYIRRQQHKNSKHQDIKQKEPPQKYRLGTISNTKLLVGLNRF